MVKWTLGEAVGTLAVLLVPRATIMSTCGGLRRAGAGRGGGCFLKAAVQFLYIVLLACRATDYPLWVVNIGGGVEYKPKRSVGQILRALFARGPLHIIVL